MTNPDGTVDLYFGPEPPSGKQSNWTPTKTGGRFDVLFPLYGLQKPSFKKSWKLPDIASTKYDVFLKFAAIAGIRLWRSC